MLTHLPPLPIVVDYSRATIKTSKEESRAAAALRYPDRVRRIAIQGPNLLFDRVYRAMNRPFPTLESFELNAYGSRFEVPTIFIRSAPSLRHLRLHNVLFSSFSQLLSSTTGLVELDLDIDTVVCLSPAESLLTHMQGMPCLCRLRLHASSLTTRISVFNISAADVVPLPRLTHLQYTGSTPCFEALAAGLAAPSLRDLEIKLNDHSSTFPHLSRFIEDVEGLFFAVRVDITSGPPQFSMLTHSHSIDEPPRKIAIQNGTTYSVQIGTAFGAKLTTAEQLFFQRPWTSYMGRDPWFHKDAIAWRELFKQFHNVKILRVGRDLLLDVARFLFLNSGGPPVLLPSLEEIELRLAAPALPISDIEREEVLSNLNVFIAARQRVGRPVRISWNADHALPSPYQ